MAIGSVYRAFLEVAREHGVDVDGALSQLDLTYAQLVEHNTRLTPDQGRTLGKLLMRRLPNPDLRYQLGLRAAERFVASDADLLGYIMLHSATSLEAAQALARHGRLLGDSADYQVEENGDRITLKLGLLGGKPMVPEGADFTVGAFFRMLHDGTGGRARPLEVHLQREQPPCTRDYRRFFGVTVQFGAVVPALVYTRSSLLAPLRQHDEKLVRILSQQADAQLKSLPPSDDWRNRVRALIADGLARDDYALERIAWRCGIGERTLRRRLVDAGTSYRMLVDEVRKERALALLDHTCSVTDVAQRVGFSDSTAFARAFRRWTGLLPHQAARARRER